MLINDSIITETVVPETVVDAIDSTIMAIEEVATLDSSAVIKECVKNDVISYLEKLAIFKGDSTVNDSIKAIIYTSITEYIMDIKDSSENPVSPINPNFLSLVFIINIPFINLKT